MTITIIILIALLCLAIAYAVHLDIKWAEALADSEFLNETNKRICNKLAESQNEIKALKSIIIDIDRQERDAIKAARIETIRIATIARHEERIAQRRREKAIEDIERGKGG